MRFTIRNTVFAVWGILTGTLLFSACESLDNSISSDPYGGGKEALGIKLLSDSPVPSSGYPGDTVIFRAKGLSKWSDPSKEEYQFKFYIGGQETQILTATDTTLTIKVPYEVSSGATYIVLQNQVFYGPNFPVLGNVAIDNNYKLMREGTDDAIYTALEKYSNVPNYFMAGAFSVIGSNSTNGIGYVNNLGDVAADKSTNFGISTGLTKNLMDLSSTTYIKSLSSLKDGRMVISGSFQGYEFSNPKVSGVLSDLASNVALNNIAILKKNAVIDTVSWQFEEVPKKYYGISRLNGGTNTEILHSFVTKDDKIVAVGNFTQYLRTDYQSSYVSTNVVSTDARNVLRMDVDGNLDTAYRPSTNGSLYTGASGGVITGAAEDEADGVVIVGNFTSFDGVTVHGLVRLDSNGNVDRTFVNNYGSGANGAIEMVKYNKKLRKMVITGGFTSFNGQTRPGLAIVNADGTLDTHFVPKTIVGGAVNFAQLIDKEKVVVSGTFTKYEGVARTGFLILEMDGTAKQDYNVPGEFRGQLYDIKETETTVGSYGLLLLGKFSRFSGKAVHNIVMLEADFEH